MLDILKDGLKKLFHSHIVGQQVQDNLDSFINNLDTAAFEVSFGEPVKFLGNGVFGSVFSLRNNKILKITFDYREAPFLNKYCINGKTPGLVNVDSVSKIKFGNIYAYITIRDNITVYKDVNKINTAFNLISTKGHTDVKEINNIMIALNAMYKIDPKWRGTHANNIGIQNGKIVLYDGFSKNIKLDDFDIPYVDIIKEIEVFESVSALRIGCGVAIVHNNKVLMVHATMRKKPNENNNKKWGLPKGLLEKGESLKACAAREIKEEIGVDIDPDKLEEGFEYTYHSNKGGMKKVYIFICTISDLEAVGLDNLELLRLQLDLNEINNVDFFSYDDAIKNVESKHLYAIKKLKALGYFDSKIKEDDNVDEKCEILKYSDFVKEKFKK
jgi:8-oxo-dGTP pyrophosphatase MutT (NUDIX family)